jgi:hypothetical protein
MNNNSSKSENSHPPAQQAMPTNPNSVSQPEAARANNSQNMRQWGWARKILFI